MLALMAALAASLVVPSLSLTCPICPTGGGVGNFTEAAMRVPISPIGNPPLTYTALTVTGSTLHADEREYLVNLGLDSTKGAHSRPTPYHDKVTLYASVVAQPGTGDVWAINPLVTMQPYSGDYDAQGIEMDFNNNNVDRGNADAGAGLAPPSAYGISVTGAGAHLSTSAYLVSGPGTHRIWNRGITFANDAIQQSSFQDLGNPDKSIDIRGSPKYGVYQSSTKSMNYFAGKTCVQCKEAEDSLTSSLHVGGDISYEGVLKRRVAIASSRSQGSASGGAVPVLRYMSEQQPQRTMSLVFSGNVILNRTGEATVFITDELNPSSLIAGGHTYSLTPVGAAAPNLHVSRPLQSEEPGAISFSVAGGVAQLQVSWSVTAHWNEED